MYYIGIDVGKEKHCAYVINQYGEILDNPFFLSNNQKGFNYFINVVKTYFI